MSREIKLGILAIFALGSVLWGFNFIKGQNLFTKSTTIYTKYDNVAGLNVSSPVYVNGFQVGAVKSISLNKDNLQEMIVEMRIEGEYNIPTNAKAVMRSDGLVSGMAVDLDFDKLCDGSNCLKNGGTIPGEKLGLLGSMLTDGEMDVVSEKVKESTRLVIDDLGRTDSNAPVNIAVRELSTTMQNMTQMTAATNELIRRSSKSIETTMANMAAITKNLAASNEQITSMLNNMNTLTQKLASSDIDQMTNNAGKTFAEAEVSLKNLSSTLELANNSFRELSATLSTVNNGDGSLSKLLTDKHLYENLSSTSKNLSLLLQDMRLNPQRYVSISVFGKKNETYVKPADDPAYK